METGTGKKASLQAERKGVKLLTKQAQNGEARGRKTRNSQATGKALNVEAGRKKKRNPQATTKAQNEAGGRKKRNSQATAKRCQTVKRKLPFWEFVVSDTATKRLKKLKWLRQHLNLDANVVIDFTKKLDLKPEETFAGKIEYLQKILEIILSPGLGEEKINVLTELHKLVQEEITHVVEMLKELYKQKAECEDLVLHESMKSQAAYPALPQLASRLPIWIGGQNEIPPPMCGAIPPLNAYKILPNHFVAAFVIPYSADNEIPLDEELGIGGSWILARCIGYQKEKYLVTDIDDVPQPLFKVRNNGLIPLPLYRADPERNPEAIFPVGAVVLALYTNTTCFFPAIIVDTPKTLGDTYTLRFRHLRNKLHWGPLANVQQRYVIQYREAYNVFSKGDKQKFIEMHGPKYICYIDKKRASGEFPDPSASSTHLSL